MLDRTNSPEIQEIREVSFEMPQEKILSNGIRIYYFNDAEQPIIKLEFVFRAGAKYHPNYQLASTVSKLIGEGTSKRTADEISTLIDGCGAILNTETGNEFASLKLVVLHKHLDKMLHLIAEILEDAIFPLEELDLYLMKKQQELIINNQKVSFVARNRFPALLFGENHVYGRPMEWSDFQDVNRDGIIEFYETYYKSGLFDLFISGSIPQNLFDELEIYFGSRIGKKPDSVKTEGFETASNRIHRVSFPDMVQNALRIGRLWPSRRHADHAGLQVLVTLFGGYFGSRLMTNIREDKGLTYGIGAGVKIFKEASMMFIGTEVNADNYKQAIAEIESEIKKLQTDLVSDEELNTVKSVIQGSFQRGFDGSFARLDRFKELILNDLEMDYYAKHIESIKNLQPNDLRLLAANYLCFDDMHQLIVGKI